MKSKGKVKPPRHKGKITPTATEAEFEIQTQELQKRIKAFEMRSQGQSYDEIAKELNLRSSHDAVDLVRYRLKDLRMYEQEQVEDVWLMDYYGLLAVKLKLQKAIANGGRQLASNATALVRVHQRIASMIGYDKPIMVKNVHEGTVNVNSTAHLSIDYSRLTADELGVLERILERLAVGTAQDQGGKGEAQLQGVRSASVAGSEPVN